jgi:hypothetical protein
MRPYLRRALIALLVVVAALGTVRPAAAEVNGNCDAFVVLPDGRQVSVRELASGDAGDAIRVSRDDEIKVKLVSQAGADHHQVHLEFVGVQVPIIDASGDIGANQEWSGTLRPDHYAKWGVGLYKIVWDETGASGKCQASALIRISGFPLFSIAGGLSTSLGGVGLIATLLLVFHEGQPWSIELVGDGTIVRKRRWRMVVTSVGASVVLSAVTAVSAFVAAQEAGLGAPTVKVLLTLTVPSTLLGFLAASLGSFIGFRRGRRLPAPIR